MVRRLILGAVIASSLGAIFVMAQGCGLKWGEDETSDWYGIGTNCPEGLPLDCCQCPWPEDCPPWNTHPIKTIPDSCLPYLAKVGCPGPARYQHTYDLSLCERAFADGGTNADDAGDGGMTFCSSGTCVPPAPEAWKHVAFAMTWPALPPACPEDTPIVAFEGSPAPPERSCSACSCDAPEGKCNLPTTWIVKTVGCDDPAVGVQTSFDPQAGWDGTCTSTNAIALGKQCGGVPCVRSITISPPVIEEKPCVPHKEGDVELPIPKAWNDADRMPVGRACVSNEPLPSCSGKGCNSTRSEFCPCLLHDGDPVCPDGWSGDRHVLYGQIEDSRECSPCGCDAPKGGTCQVKWRTFSTATCSVENAAVDIYAGMAPACTDLMPGVALAGKTAELVNYTKGSCTPNGGELGGDLKLDYPVTVCCYSSMM